MTIAKKTTKPTTSKVATRSIGTNLQDQPLELLTPDEFAAITAATYDNPQSRIVLRLLINANYFWHVSRHVLGLPSPITEVDWRSVERNTAQLVRNTFDKLLPQVDTTPWHGRVPDTYKKV